MESTCETHPGVARLTPRGQLRALHGITDDEGAKRSDTPEYNMFLSSRPERLTTNTNKS